jgi:hypothetical protein
VRQGRETSLFPLPGKIVKSSLKEMFVISDYTLTPISTEFAEIVIPGVYGIERFATIQNATRNDILYTAEVENLGSISVTDDGLQTTVIVRVAEVGVQATDELRILLYNPAPTGGGPTADVNVLNWPASQNVNGVVNIGNEVEIANDAGNPVPVTGTVDVGNLPAVQTVTGTVDVGNFPAVQDVEVTNFPATQVVTQGTTPWIIESTINTEVSVSAFPTTSTDAFGRLRVSEPYTLFDSSTRYGPNSQWATQTLTGGTANFNADQGLMDLTVTSAVTSTVLRETKKVFSYQPGKSLLLFTTFVMSGASGLRQSVGYFNDFNGYFLQRDTNSTAYLVERSRVTGSTNDNRVAQINWNIDPFDGTGPSGITLDFTKAQILWIDMEWLGVGTVRTGFVVDGQLLPANYFQHANIVDSTYITTACLPFRYEIENISSGVGGTLKQICSTAISEGGYTLTGEQHSVSTPITTPYVLAAAGTYYPVAALRLKSTRLDAISIVTGLSMLGAGNNETYAWRVVSGGTVSDGSWDTVSATTPVEYNLTGTSVTGGTVLASGFTNASNQGSPIIDILKGSLFANQLERNPFTATATEFILEVAPAGNTQEIYVSVNWEDVVM